MTSLMHSTEREEIEYQCFPKCRSCGSFIRLGDSCCWCGCQELVIECISLDVLASYGYLKHAKAETELKSGILKILANLRKDQANLEELIKSLSNYVEVKE